MSSFISSWFVLQVMRTIVIWGCLLAVLMVPCMSDMYMHFPPGSNNRLNGNQDNVRNANRLFDSQNNGKAGYNVGDKLDKNPGDNIPEFRQLPMEFYMSGCDAKAKTEVEIMWTNQHGTGPKTDDRVETQVILQYMCQPYPEGKMATADVNREFEYHTIRNGQTLNTQNFANGARENAYIRKDRGLHEPANYYQAYFRRERNKGLFTADQQLKGDLPIYTRQNPAGTRRGLEVPEERDYYPYWGPTPWKDIAIMVSNKKAEDLMKKYVNSPEYGYKYMCIMPTTLQGNPVCPRDNQNSLAKHCVAKYITADSCKAAGGRWTQFIENYLEKTAGVLSTCHNMGEMKLARGLPYEPHTLSQGADGKVQFVLRHKRPEVIYAPSTVVNHNGMNMEGKFSSYKWKVPCFPTNTTQRCVLRLRYNITTDDVPREFDASNNKNVTNNPKTKTVDGKTDLQLALNTAQLGRTFQDRSHVILLKPRSTLPLKYQHSKIYYIGGMGKRGNIVQAYPAMEYRFTPERISVTTDDVVCFVWSGSNNNQNNEGEGTARTDRTNVCWVKEGCSSLKPKACSSLPLEVVDHIDDFNAAKLNLHLNKGCYTGNDLQAQLNNAPASCNPPCFRITKPGEYCYMGTRNNNFSNRRHMGQITVVEPEDISV
ncbi:protein DD3-3-like isoform X1 [Oculina patagonica]